MASKGVVTLNGRFRPGTEVRLVKVRDETVLRSEGGEEVGTAKVDKHGQVKFDAEPGARYFIVGHIDGFPVEVRARGNKADDDNSTLAQAPIAYTRVKLADGSFADERPEKRDAGFGGVGPAPSLDQVPAGTPLRSDTGRGYAHPVDSEELAPYPPQSEFEGEEQRSATPEGQATPVGHQVPVSQEDVKEGTLQRSDTELGVATPIPAGDAVQAQEVRESAETKASVGEPVKAAAAPLDAAKARKRAAKKSAAKKSNQNENKE
jgi:hypothetical protein